MVDIDLSGRFAAVTGGARGIGHAIVRALAEAGAAVAVLDKDADAAEETASSLRRGGGDARALALDVTDRVQVDAVVDALWTQRPIDIWVNNAGVSSMGRLVDLTDEDWDFNMDVNAKDVFLCSRAVARKMLFRERGTIVNVASMAGLKVLPQIGVYCMSKAAVVHMTRAMALEWGRFGINVNAICPGYIDTEMNHEHWDTEAGRKLMDMLPRKRVGRAEDLDPVLLMLASGQSHFVNGAVISADDGFGV